MSDLISFLTSRAINGLLTWVDQLEVAKCFCMSIPEVETQALQLGILPARYQRNRQTISVVDQLTLHESRVVVVGCGGLGGYVIEELARLGVGTLVGIDPDVFEEHNLNRQLLSSIDALGQSKTMHAALRVENINPAVTFHARNKRLEPENAIDLLGGCQVAVDALDSVSSRLALRDACAQLDIPLVHGAIAGWYGQVTTEYPDDGTLATLYGHSSENKGAESQLGNPAFTPAVVASLEAAEVCKVLVAKGKPLRKRLLTVNLLDMSFETISL